MSDLNEKFMFVSLYEALSESNIGSGGINREEQTKSCIEALDYAGLSLSLGSVESDDVAKLALVASHAFGKRGLPVLHRDVDRVKVLIQNLNFRGVTLTLGGNK